MLPQIAGNSHSEKKLRRKYESWIDAWEKGASIEQIAKSNGKTLNTARCTIYKFRKLYGWFPSRPCDRVNGRSAAEVKYRRWLDLWGQGKTVAQIANIEGLIFNKVNTTIYGLRKRYGWFPARPGRGLTIAEARHKYQSWLELWDQGVSQQEMAESLGLPFKRVRNKIMALRRSYAFFGSRKNDRARTPQAREEKYRAWRRLWDEGKTTSEIAQSVGISVQKVRASISNLRRLRHWFPKHLRPSPAQRYADILALWDRGEKVISIADKLGYSYARVRRIIEHARKAHGLFKVRVREQGQCSRPMPRSPRHRILAGQTTDKTLRWLTSVYGDRLELWRGLAERYFEEGSKTGLRSFSGRLSAVGVFLSRYVPEVGVFRPEELLARNPSGKTPPPLLGSTPQCVFDIKKRSDVSRYNSVCDFLDWVLDHDERFCEEDDDAAPHRLPGFEAIPFRRYSARGFQKRTESVRPPLPYRYLVDMRNILAPGRNFSDWKWAQAINVRTGLAAGNWFEVSYETVQSAGSDPDFVWKKVTVGEYDRNPRTIYLAWSPVAAVALLIKLHLPLRLFQIRMLDDGSTDASRCELASDSPAGSSGGPITWKENRGRKAYIRALAPELRPLLTKEQGVFRKIDESLTRQVVTGLFINTNKTADIDKPWAERGYTIHWENKEVLYWLIKLRDWQEKYNPVTCPLPWTKLTRKHLGAIKSDLELSSASPTTFLFRDAAAKKNGDERALPIPGASVEKLWDEMLVTFEEVLWRSGARTKNEGRVALVKKRIGSYVTTHFPLHALRVSLLTTLAFEGGVSLRSLMELAGHSTILMAIYYQKLGAVVTGQELEEGFRKALLLGEKRVEAFLMQKTLDQIAQLVVSADLESIQANIPVDPSDRTPAGLLRVIGGFCLVGGNTTPNTENKKLGGCFNGGQRVAGTASHPVWRSVTPRDCIGGGCRHFVTRPEFLPELHAKVRNLFYHMGEALKQMNDYDRQLKSLAVEKKVAREADQPFLKHREELNLMSLSDKAHAEVDALLDKVCKTLGLIDRTVALLKSEKSTDALIPQGTFDDVKVAIETTSSELLAISGLCLDAQVYPELKSEIGAAAIRRSQIMDLFFLRQYNHPVLSVLSPDQQLLLGNAIMRGMTSVAEQLVPGHALELVCAGIEGTRELPNETVAALEQTLQDANIQVRSKSLAELKLPSKTLISLN